MHILDNKPFNSFRIFFWIGCRANDSEGSFEMCMRELQELMEEHLGGAKMRIHIEFQYAESFTFLTLFNSFEREIDYAASNTDTLYHVIQYQDYLLTRGGGSQARAVSFPKILILEYLDQEYSPLSTFVRIYERENLDHDLTVHELHTSSLVYIMMDGFYVDKAGI